MEKLFSFFSFAVCHLTWSLAVQAGDPRAGQVEGKGVGAAETRIRVKIVSWEMKIKEKTIWPEPEENPRSRTVLPFRFHGGFCPSDVLPRFTVVFSVTLSLWTLACLRCLGLRLAVIEITAGFQQFSTYFLNTTSDC